MALLKFCSIKQNFRLSLTIIFKFWVTCGAIPAFYTNRGVCCTSVYAAGTPSLTILIVQIQCRCLMLSQYNPNMAKWICTCYLCYSNFFSKWRLLNYQLLYVMVKWLLDKSVNGYFWIFMDKNFHIFMHKCIHKPIDHIST